MTYYNENDPFAAAWLRELIKAGAIAPGDVDDRSIADVRATDLAGYEQCHFFAGIGGWSHALRLAGWPDERPVWTGSCPCQPYSAAGKGGGTADPRHLWPVWERLIAECRPPVVFGEQVAAAIGHGWADLVRGDLEAQGYAFGMVVLGAHSVGAPHIRQRLYFVADAPNADGRTGERRAQAGVGAHGERGRGLAGDGAVGELGDTKGRGQRVCGGASGGSGRSALTEQAGFVGDTDEPRLQGHGELDTEHGTAGWQDTERHEPEARFWDACEWLPCRDGKTRPVEPGTFPLAHGVPARVGRLRGYGNAIVPQAAAEVIRAYMMGHAPAGR